MKRREFIGQASALGIGLPLLAIPGEESVAKAIQPGVGVPGLPTKKKQVEYRPNAQSTDEEWAAYLVKQWERTGLLKGLPEEQKPTVVLALENQRLWNENSGYYDTAGTNIAQFKRISIPLIRRLVPHLMEQFSVCSSLHAKAPLMKYFPRNYWTNSGRQPFKGLWNKTMPELFMQYQAWGRGQMHNLDVEADEVVKLVEYTAEDISEIVEMHNLQRSKRETLCFYYFGWRGLEFQRTP